ncbi:MAG: hypothetical protein BWY77_01677 [bacterium ADurb.Bin431]|nr:MAG: hypothetical protein BWY77_01677 [bacterium ADurb.Bin431]
MGFEKESVRGELQPEHLLQPARFGCGLYPERKDEHVEDIAINLAGGRVFNRNLQAAVGQFLHAAGEPPQVMYAQPAAAQVQVLEALAEGADVDIEHRNAHIRIMLFEHKGAFDCVHAAGVGAVGAPLAGRPRSYALDESDRPRFFAVFRPHQLALGGTTRIDQALKLKTGHHVFKSGIAVLIQLCRVVRLGARGHDDGAHLLGQLFIRHVEIDAVLFAGLDALCAHRRIEAEALLVVDQVGGRHGLRERLENRPAGGESRVIFIGPNDRADSGTIPAGGTRILINIAGALAQLDLKVSDVAF